MDGVLTEEPTLFRGQWGIAQDGEGRLYYNTNSNLLSGDAYDAQNLVAAGAAAAPGLNARVSTDDAMYAVRVNTGVNRAYLPGVLREDGRLNQPTSASGMAVQGSVAYVAEPAANAVARLALTENALGVSASHERFPDPEWGQREFLASTDERFRPVNVYTGPDGALYVVDMYRGVIQDHVFITEQLREQAKARGLDRPPGLGRIWRVSAEGGAYGAADLSSVDARLAALSAGNPWARRTAQRLLVADTRRGVKRALQRTLKEASAPGALHALWALSARGELKRADALRAVRSGPLPLARQAVIAGAPLFSKRDVLTFAGLHADDARFQLEAIAALALHTDENSVRAHVSTLVLERWQDEAQRLALVSAMRGHEQPLIESLAGSWTAEQEEKSSVLEAAATQHMNRFSNDGARLQGLLDIAAEQPGWAQRALLDGMASVTRREGFERVTLPEAHALFAAPPADESLWPALAGARKAFTWPGDTLAADAEPLSPDQQARRAEGAEYYASHCATCHGAGGEGIAALAPPLVDSSWVTEAPERLARIVLQGLQGPIEVKGETWNGVMPGHAQVPEFDDEVASGLLTHLHRSWGHAGRPIDPPFVAAMRQATEGRSLPWTAEELMAVPVNTHFQAFDGRYGGGPFELAFSYDGESQLEVRTGLFTGPLEPRGNGRFVFAPRGMHFDFVRDSSGHVQGVTIRSGDETGNTLPRIGDIDE